MIHPAAFIHPSASVESGASIGARCKIEALAYVGRDVILGEDCQIGRSAILEGKLEAGRGCVIQAGVHLVAAGGSGAKLGAECVLRSFAVVYDEVQFGDRVRIGHHSVVRPGTRLGDDVSIGNLNQLEGALSVGEKTRFHSNVHISMHSTIGARCFIGPGFVPTNTPYPLSPLDSLNTPGVTVEDDVKIGANVTTAPGVRIGSHSLVGLGSVVLRDIPSGTFVGGNPCRIIRPVAEIVDKVSGIYPYKNG